MREWGWTNGKGDNVKKLPLKVTPVLIAFLTMPVEMKNLKALRVEDTWSSHASSVDC